MRKFYAAIALCITLIGTFSPVFFSVSLLGNTPKINVQKNVAFADIVDVSFGGPITIIDTPDRPGFYRLETTIRYDSPTRGTGSPFNNGSFFGTFPGSLDPHYRVVNTDTNTAIIDEKVSDPQNLGLKDATYGPMRQDIEITTPGKYEAYFYEDYTGTDELPSSKIKFEITANKHVINATISAQRTNITGDDQIEYTIITGDINPTTPTEAKFSIGVTYKNTNKQTVDDAPENLWWSLTDKATGSVTENAINLNPKPKYNTLRNFTITIPNLIAGKEYSIKFLEKDILTTQGNPKSSQPFPFKAGEVIDNDATQQQIQQDNAAAAQSELEKLSENAKAATDSGDSCAATDITCKFFILILDFILFIPNAIMVIGGLFMDISLGISINPAMYGINGDTLETGLRTAWALIRDFSNIGFIFALFIAAFSLILNKDLMGFQPKKTVVRVIVMALMVNFSFMMCRVIIQTADIFSHILYDKISVSGETQSVVGDSNVGGVNLGSLVSTTGYKSPSMAVVSEVNPQAILLNKGLLGEDTHLSTATGTALGATLGAYNGGWEGALIGGAAGAAGAFNWKTTSFYVLYGTVAVISFFIYLILIYTFVATGIVFLGRVFGLWIGVILSPLAFVSYSIPFIAENPYIGFEKWLNSFVQLAFTTPIFLLFIYIAMSVLKIRESIIPKGLDTSTSIIAVLLATLIPALASMFIILKGKKIATDMAGEVGKLAAGATGWATTLALGAATGGTAMLGRQTLGQAGSALANANRGDNSFLGKGMRTMGDKLGAASFDVRKNGTAMKRFGKFTEMSGEKIDLGTRGLREGGFNAEGTLSEQYRKRQERIAKEQEEKLKKEAADALLNAQAKDAQELREREAKLEAAKKAKEAEDARIAMEAENQGPQAFIDKKNAEKATEEAALQNLKDEKDVLDATGIQLHVDKATIESEKATLLSEETNLGNQLSTLEGDKASLEAQLAAIPNDGSKISKEEKAEVIKKIEAKDKEISNQKTLIANNKVAIDTKDKEIEAKDKEIQDNQKLADKKGEEVGKKQKDINKIDSYGTHLAGITSVRDARQKKADLELEATHSQEKALMEKNKTDMDEKKAKAEEAQKELNALNTKLKNEKDETKKAQIEADIAEKTAERNKKDNEYKKAKDEHKAAKQRYDDAFGNKISALSDFEKEALKTYENDASVITRKTDAQNAVIAAQKDVNASQNNLDNLNYQFQQKYADDLEKKAAAYQKVFGRMTEHVATATGGLIGGEALNNAGENAAAGVRRDASKNY